MKRRYSTKQVKMQKMMDGLSIDLLHLKLNENLNYTMIFSLVIVTNLTNVDTYGYVFKYFSVLILDEIKSSSPVLSFSVMHSSSYAEFM